MLISRLSIGPMSHVNFEKCSCRHVEFEGQGPQTIESPTSRVGLFISMSAWLPLGNQLICILWQEFSHWPSKSSKENPSTGQTRAGLMRGPPAINQREQCILGGGRDSCLEMAEGD